MHNVSCAYFFSFSEPNNENQHSWLIYKQTQKLVFGYVSLTANFWSSLARCYSAMVSRSRHKNLCRLLAKFPIFEFICVYTQTS